MRVATLNLWGDAVLGTSVGRCSSTAFAGSSPTSLRSKRRSLETSQLSAADPTPPFEGAWLVVETGDTIAYEDLGLLDAEACPSSLEGKASPSLHSGHSSQARSSSPSTVSTK